MAYYSESGYCAEEASRRPYAGEPGLCHGEGGERYAVVRKEEYEEADEVARAGRGHYGHGHGHLGHTGSHRRHGAAVHGGHHGHGGGYLGERREHYDVHGGHGHGHGGARLYDACESKRYDSCNGEYYA